MMWLHTHWRQRNGLTCLFYIFPLEWHCNKLGVGSDTIKKEMAIVLLFWKEIYLGIVFY